MKRPLTYYDDLMKKSIASDALVTSPSSYVAQIQTVDGDILIGNIFGLLGTSRSGVLETSFRITQETLALLALEHFNSRSSPLVPSLADQTTNCNFYLTIDYRDSQFSPIEGGRLFQQEFIVKDQTDRLPSFAVLGPSRSAESTLVATLGGVTSSGVVKEGSKPTGIPNISPSSTSSQLDDHTQYPYFARTIPTNAGDAEALCLFLTSINVHHLGVLYVNDSYGGNFVLDLTNAASKYNIQLQTYNYKDDVTGSFESALQQMKLAADLTYWFGIFTATYWESNILELYDNKLIGPDSANGKIWFFGETFTTVYGLEIAKNSDRAQDVVTALNQTGVIALNRPVDKFLLATDELQARLDDPDFVDYFLSRHTDCLLATLPPSNFTEMYPPSVSLYSIMTYDAVMALGLAACKLSTNNNTNDPFFVGSELFDAIMSLSFLGATGNVSFDRETGTRTFAQVKYEIVNLIVDYNDTAQAFQVNDVVTNLIQSSATSIQEMTPFIYADGSTIAPSSLPRVQQNLNLVPVGIRAFCWCLAGMVMLFAVYCALWTYLNRKRGSVSTSQPLFLGLLCLGTFTMAFSIITSTFQEPMELDVLDAACMANIWFLSVGFTVTFAALFSKMWRINQVFSNAERFRRVKVRVSDVLWPLVVLMVLNGTILVVWTTVDPLNWIRVPVKVDDFDRVLSSRGTCFDPGSSSNDGIFLAFLLAVNLFALVMSNYQSYRARKLPTRLNETSYIAMSNVILLEALVLGIPLLVVVFDDPTSFMLVRSIVVAILCLAVLLPMFIPKFAKSKDVFVSRKVSTGPEVSRVSSSTSQWEDEKRIHKLFRSNPFASGLVEEESEANEDPLTPTVKRRNAVTASEEFVRSVDMSVGSKSHETRERVVPCEKKT